MEYRPDHLAKPRAKTRQGEWSSNALHHIRESLKAKPRQKAIESRRSVKACRRNHGMVRRVGRASSPGRSGSLPRLGSSSRKAQEWPAASRAVGAKSAGPRRLAHPGHHVGDLGNGPGRRHCDIGPASSPSCPIANETDSRESHARTLRSTGWHHLRDAGASPGYPRVKRSHRGVS